MYLSRLQGKETNPKALKRWAGRGNNLWRDAYSPCREVSWKLRPDLEKLHY